MAAARRGRSWSPRRRYAAVCAVIAVALILVLIVIVGLPVYPAWVVGLSVVTFLVYGYDKRRAVRDGGRVPEVVLHGLALAGGFPGGWAGRSIFRHKTRRPSFLVVLVLSAILHAVLVWQLYVS